MADVAGAPRPNRQIQHRFFGSVESGNLEEVKSMLAQRADPNHGGIEGMTPLISAVLNTQLAVVKYLVEEAHAEVDASGFQGSTALISAAEASDDIGIVNYLVKAKASVDGRDQAGSTVLMFAAGFGHLNIVKYLVEVAKAATDARDDQGDTALHWALRQKEKCLSTSAYLVESGNAEVGIEHLMWLLMVPGELPLVLAERIDEFKVFQFVRSVSLEVSQESSKDKSWSAMKEALQHCNPKMVSFVIKVAHKTVFKALQRDLRTKKGALGMLHRSILRAIFLPYDSAELCTCEFL